MGVCLYYTMKELGAFRASFYFLRKLLRELDFSYANQESSMSNGEIAVVVGSPRQVAIKNESKRKTLFET